MAGAARNELIAIVVIVSAGAFLRLAWLGDVPPPMNQDEVLRGYDAWCLWETGCDYRGARWPMFLQAFGPGEYVSAISAYITAPLIGALGPYPWVVRMPFALAGIATVLIVWRWMRGEFGALVGCASAAMLAINPWHVHVSRVAFEGDLSPWLTAGGAWLGLAGAARRPSTRVLGGMLLGLAMWTYPAPRVVIPPLVAAWAWWMHKRQTAAAWRQIVPLAAGVIIGAAPLWLTALAHPEIVLARASNVGVFSAAGSAGAKLAQVSRQYVEHFNPVTLSIVGERSTHQYPAEMPFVPPVELLLAAAGAAWLAARCRRSITGKLLMLWLLLYPLPAALTHGGMPGMVRSIMGLPLIAILAGLGVGAGVHWYARRKAGVPRAAWALGMAIWGIMFSLTAMQYLGDAGQRAATPQNRRMTAVFTWLREHRQPGDAVLVAFRTNQGFAYHLFFERVPPREAHSQEVVRRPWTGGFEQVLRWNQTSFCPADLGRELSTAEIELWAASVGAGRRKLVILLPDQPCLPAGFEPLRQETTKDGFVVLRSRP